MSDVSVNIRGRDDGLGAQLDSLRTKANQLGRDISDLNRLSDMTPTEKRLSIKGTSDEVAREQRRRIKEEFNAARKSNNRDFSEAKSDFSSGRISKDAFDIQKKRFAESNESLLSDENGELIQVEKDSSNLLRLIYRELSTKEKLERERAQRDKDEFSDSKNSGYIGGISAENRRLRAQQAASTDDAEIALLQSKIDSNNATVREYRGKGDVEEETNYSGLSNGALSAARGDASGAFMGGMQALGGMGKMAKGFSIAAIIAMIVKEALGHGEKVQEAIGQTAAMRGLRGTGAGSNKRYQNLISSNSLINDLGFSGDEFAELMNQKASSSRMTGNLTKRTLDDEAFKKGFGADVGIFSQFERFTKSQENSVSIGLDVLNVLTSINKSSLKEGDLTTLSEKLNSQQTIMSMQRQKRDSVDSTGALRVLSAFESIGLSSKGERGADFLTQTIQGLGDGGGDNAMMLKYEAARRARPDLANDPAALKRFVKFHSDDPTYMKEAFGFLGDVSGGNEMAQDDLIYSLFNPQSEKDMDMYKKAMNGDGNFNKLLQGDNISNLKTRKGTLDKDTMFSDAESSVGAITEGMKLFSNFIQKLAIDAKGSVNVNVVEDKTKVKTASKAIVINKVKTGS